MVSEDNRADVHNLQPPFPKVYATCRLHFFLASTVHCSAGASAASTSDWNVRLSIRAVLHDFGIDEPLRNGNSDKIHRASALVSLCSPRRNEANYLAAVADLGVSNALGVVTIAGDLQGDTFANLDGSKVTMAPIQIQLTSPSSCVSECSRIIARASSAKVDCSMFMTIAVPAERESAFIEPGDLVLPDEREYAISDFLITANSVRK